MDSTVRSRPTHYELLGLTPEAKLDEIDEAFARELRLPRAFGSLAEFTVAYETLRDPIRRKAYDASIERKPEPRPALSLAGRLEGAALGAPPAKPVVRIKSPSPPSPVAPPRPQPEPRPALRRAPSATALLHQPIAPTIPQRDPTPQSKREDSRRPDPVARRGPESRTVSEEVLRPALDHTEHGRHVPFHWKLPALAAGALVLAIGGGAWMGVESGNDVPADQLKPAVTLKVPPAKAAAPITASADEAPGIADARSPQPEPAARPSAKEAVRPPLQIDLPDEQPTEVAALEQQQRGIEQVTAAAPAPAVATDARMPLPNSVIARTIGRIGYPCGQVASTTPVDGGAAGVFTVTCTSGHSYRAAPVNGRYRFRRLSGR